MRGGRLGCLTERLWDSKTTCSLSMAPLMWCPEAGRNRNLESQLFVSTSRFIMGIQDPLKNPANPRPDKGPGHLISLTWRQQKEGCPSPSACPQCCPSTRVQPLYHDLWLHRAVCRETHALAWGTVSTPICLSQPTWTTVSPPTGSLRQWTLDQPWVCQDQQGRSNGELTALSGELATEQG